MLGHHPLLEGERGALERRGGVGGGLRGRVRGVTREEQDAATRLPDDARALAVRLVPTEDARNLRINEKALDRGRALLSAPAGQRVVVDDSDAARACGHAVVDEPITAPSSASGWPAHVLSVVVSPGRPTFEVLDLLSLPLVETVQPFVHVGTRVVLARHRAQGPIVQAPVDEKSVAEDEAELASPQELQHPRVLAEWVNRVAEALQHGLVTRTSAARAKAAKQGQLPAPGLESGLLATHIAVEHPPERADQASLEASFRQVLQIGLRLVVPIRVETSPVLTGSELREEPQLVNIPVADNDMHAVRVARLQI
mmetsp:Transcript_81152/g.225842  ORF Transcript_81152/g.225842 Transcript_81152/m.225842 type:complete len:312 (-) Transcript_81152:650-1585(-)